VTSETVESARGIGNMVVSPLPDPESIDGKGKSPGLTLGPLTRWDEEVTLLGEGDRGDNDGDLSLPVSPGNIENESLSIDCFLTSPAVFCARKIWALTA
jgi:hypothetical protein